VPFLLYPDGENPGTSYNEKEAERSGILIEDGSRILDVLLKGE
jgi:hypothetical protein